MRAQRHEWSVEDEALEEEFADVLELLEPERAKHKVPGLLDRKVKRLARRSPTSELLDNWIFSQAARLSLAMLVFFAIAMYWLLAT